MPALDACAQRLDFPSNEQLRACFVWQTGRQTGWAALHYRDGWQIDPLGRQGGTLEAAELEIASIYVGRPSLRCEGLTPNLVCSAVDGCHVRIKNGRFDGENRVVFEGEKGLCQSEVDLPPGLQACLSQSMVEIDVSDGVQGADSSREPDDSRDTGLTAETDTTPQKMIDSSIALDGSGATSDQPMTTDAETLQDSELDDGLATAPDADILDSTVPLVLCGNGVIDDGEMCDDGNQFTEQCDEPIACQVCDRECQRRELLCDADADNDDVSDCEDNCVDATNPSQVDDDSDGVGDACDNCPMVANAEQGDQDLDGRGNACDPDYEGDESSGFGGTLGDDGLDAGVAIDRDVDAASTATVDGAVDSAVDANIDSSLNEDMEVATGPELRWR